MSGTKRFVDNTFFAGPDSVQYAVQGQRADSAGPVSGPVTVSFGRAPGGGGFVIASQSAGTGDGPDGQVRIAA
ncbi:MAG: hypothetical protein AB7K52_06395 [Phycisphaerales bacterium]